MKKRALVGRVLGLLVAILSILALFPVSASATQTLNDLISGTVTLNGKNLGPDDVATITAMIPGVNAEWSKNVVYDTGVSYYVQLMVPFNSGGSGAKNGGEDGDIIMFKAEINGVTYLDSETLKWFRATDFWHSIHLTSSEVSGLEITTTSLKDGMVGNNYMQVVEATGGAAPYTWSWAPSAGSSALPAGLTLNAATSTTGSIAGKPTVKSTYMVTIIVKDSNQITSRKDFSLFIDDHPDGLGVTTAELKRWPTEVFDNLTFTIPIPPPGWIVDVFYSDNLTATGGLPPYHWSAVGLPSGLNLADNGTLSGIPDTAGDYLVTFEVFDGVFSNSATLELKIYERGDANGKDGVGPGDISYLEKVILKLLPPTAGCDANKDGTIDVADVTEIEKIIFNLNAQSEVVAPD